MTFFLNSITKIILGILTVIFGLVTTWCIYLYLKKLCLEKFGTSNEVRELMRKYDMSRSEAKSHRLQLHQTASKIKAKEKKDLPNHKRKATKPSVPQKGGQTTLSLTIGTSSTIETEV